MLCEGVEGEEVGDEEGVADRRRLKFHRSVADLERQSPSLPARWSRGARGEEEVNLTEMLTPTGTASTLLQDFSALTRGIFFIGVCEVLAEVCVPNNYSYLRWCLLNVVILFIIQI